MRSERGQATVEWIGIVLLIALALAALSRLSPAAEPRALGPTLAHAITCPAGDRCPSPSRTDASTPPPHGPHAPRVPGGAFTAPPLVPRSPAPVIERPGARLRLPRARALLDWARREIGRLPAQGATRGVAGAWKHAWFACLVYERARWAILHPASRYPGYTFPPEEALRIANDCISPFDLFRDAPMLQP
jgi:hypothetical protein